MAKFSQMIGGSYRSQSVVADHERTINWYQDVMEVPGATSRVVLYPTPGVEMFATAIAVGWRASFTDDASGRTFGVVGASFVEVLSGGAVTIRGTVAVDANPATISTNGDGGGQLLVTSGSNAYSYDLASDTLTLEVAGEATMGAVLYGYGLIFDKATGRVRLSDLNDLTAWDPTQFFERSINSDPWQALHVTPYGYIVLPGTQTGETWYNAGSFPIPFEPDPSGQFAQGCAATFSIQQLGDTVAWLARGVEGDFRVVRQSGFIPQRISTHAVELAIAGYNADTTIEDAIGQVYGENGHLFYLLTFPTANATWCFDANVPAGANPWHERGTWISEQNRYVYWRPVFHTFAFGQHLMGDRDSGVLYRMSSSLTTDVDSRVIRRLRCSPTLMSEHRRLIVDALELLFQTGIGTGSGQGETPVAMLRVSRDGGRTWGNERRLAAGAQGQFFVRMLARMLGMGRSFTFEVTCTDPVAWMLVDAFLTVRPSTEMQAA